VEQERVLEMGERQPGVGAGESRIERDRAAEEAVRRRVVAFREAVHVPQPAMEALPGAERLGVLQDGAVPLRRLDLRGERGDDPVPDRVQGEKRVRDIVLEAVRPDDARIGRRGELDRNDQPRPAPPEGAAREVVRPEQPPGLPCGDAALGEGEDGPRAITRRLRSRASRVMMSCTNPSARSPRPPSSRARGMTARVARSCGPAAVGPKASGAGTRSSAGTAGASVISRRSSIFVETPSLR
jgi:hypothetical protein